MDIPYTWDFLPLKERPLRGAIAIGIILAFVILSYIWTQNLLICLLCACIFGMTTSSFFTKKSFAITNQGITITSRGRSQEIPWEKAKSYYKKFPKIYLFREENPRLIASRANILEFYSSMKNHYEEICGYLCEKNLVLIEPKKAIQKIK